MTDFEVTIDRPRQSRKPAAPLFGFHPRLIAAFVIALTIFTYGIMFAKYGAFEHPVEYLYPAAVVGIALLLMPGLLSVGAFYAVTGQPAEADARTIIVIVAISAVTYGSELRRVLEARTGQTP